MNLPERAKNATLAEEANLAALKRSIIDLQKLAGAQAQAIDARRLELRPAYPTFEQAVGIIEAVRRYKAGEKSSTHHGDPTGPEEWPGAVKYAPHGEVGWMHVASGAPVRVYHQQGTRLWSFTEGDIEFILQFVQGQGVTVIDHWRTDGGLSLRFERTVVGADNARAKA